jgi:hypothetical protein
MQKPLEQVYPESHELPLQHASSSEPHVPVLFVQNPLEQVEPSVQVVPLQHGSSIVPHVLVVLVQIPFEQVPLTHAEPPQHA